MSDIEEDIKFIEKMIKEYKTFGDLDNPDYEDTDRIYKAIENILAERESNQEKIKELEEENKRKDTYIKMAKEVIENSILKQEVKEILDKAEVMDYYTLPNVVKDLEEILEDKYGGDF